MIHTGFNSYDSCARRSWCVLHCSFSGRTSLGEHTVGSSGPSGRSKFSTPFVLTVHSCLLLTFLRRRALRQAHQVTRPPWRQSRNPISHASNARRADVSRTNLAVLSLRMRTQDVDARLGAWHPAKIEPVTSPTWGKLPYGVRRQRKRRIKAGMLTANGQHSLLFSSLLPSFPLSPFRPCSPLSPRTTAPHCSVYFFSSCCSTTACSHPGNL